MVHRDIKGGNILTTKEGEVKLADFGVATKLSEKDNYNSLAGTAFWMAPEVIEMNGYTSACDIWSLGCTLLELLTGHPPYYNMNSCTALLKIVQESTPPIPENISKDLLDFLQKCFVKDPTKRASATELIGA